MAFLKRIVPILLLLPSVTLALPRFSGYCQQGATNAKTQSINSSNVLQGSFPRANVTAYITGGAIGAVSTNGTSVTWTNGIQFDANSEWNGLPITINSVPYVILTVNSPTSLTLTSSAGTQTRVSYSVANAPAPIFSDYAGTTPKSNPTTCDSTGYFFFYSPNGTVDERFSGSGITSPFTLASVSGIDPFSLVPGVNPTYYPGADIGAQINAAAASPACATGCTIDVPPGTFSYTTPIVIPAGLSMRCVGPQTTILSYSGTPSTELRICHLYAGSIMANHQAL